VNSNTPSFRLLTYATQATQSKNPHAKTKPSSLPVGAVFMHGLVYDLTDILPTRPTVMDVLNDWANTRPILAALANDKTQLAQLSGQPLDAVTFLPPMLYPNGIYCAGANYTDHLAEMSQKFNLPPEPDPHDIGMPPWLFIRTARNTMVGHGGSVTIPAYSKQFDWELEVAVVIGRECKDIDVAHAMEYVAGYTIINDLSARDFMKRPHAIPGSAMEYDWISQKNFDGACPIGPWIVPSADIADPLNLDLKLWVNDTLMQDSNTGNMIFKYAELVAFLSQRFTLYPGDVVATGTPAGVGMPRGIFLKKGDTVSITVEGIGELTTSII
jgi:2-keto-4-pentenoate hydratase/2-oxohepta-3-ene-1,7-dioic acid hydratase in catechol pathway